ncbi:hypothetical protein MHU86_12972 [Fragilaria crotonensis]|nr:hypothetical protein MHU86_12972 [Fragilaria crotonensis]
MPRALASEAQPIQILLRRHLPIALTSISTQQQPTGLGKAKRRKEATWFNRGLFGMSDVTSTPDEVAETDTGLPMAFESAHMRRVLQVTTPTGSLSPNRNPTSSPSVQLVPSTTSPMLTRDPTSSNMPSAFPSFVPSAIPSDVPSHSPPTYSNSPSGLPTAQPTVGLPTAPTNKPTISPSAFPTTDPIDITRGVVEMVLQNMPYMNESSVGIWEQTTNKHVILYWNNRPFPTINIVNVNTVLLGQENVVLPDGQRFRRLENGEVTSQLSIQYEQNITLSNVAENDRIEDNQDVIFLDPFERDQATYVDNLVTNLNLGQMGAEINILRMAVLEGSPSVPTTLSPIPTGAPVSFVSNADGGLSVGAIALIATALFLVVTFGSIGYLYLRKRQHEHDLVWAADHARPIQREDEFTAEMEDYPTVVQSGRSSPREMPIVDEGDEDSNDDDETVNAYSTGPSEAYLNDLPGDDDDEDDPTLPYTPDSGHHVRAAVSFDDSSHVLDVDNDEEIHPVSPLEATSSSAGSVNDPPSMWAFQVKVTDLED